MTKVTQQLIVVVLLMALRSSIPRCSALPTHQSTFHISSAKENQEDFNSNLLLLDFDDSANTFQSLETSADSSEKESHFSSIRMIYELLCGNGEMNELTRPEEGDLNGVYTTSSDSVDETHRSGRRETAFEVRVRGETRFSKSCVGDVASLRRFLDDILTVLNYTSSGGYKSRLVRAAQMSLDEKIPAGDTSLVIAAYRGHAEVVKHLVKAGVNLEIPNPQGVTPLMLAAAHGHTEVVRVLLSAGADKDASNAKGDTPLLLAVYNGQEPNVRALLTAGVKTDSATTNGDTAVIFAAHQGREKILRLLILARADVNAKNNAGNSPLLLAAAKGKANVIPVLLKAGADVNATNKEGINALLFATKNGNEDVFPYLLAAKIDVNAKNKDGNSSLILAAKRSNVNMVRLLLEAGADVNATNDKGDSALTVAAYKGAVDIVRLLLEAGADVSTKNADGDTALIFATTRGDEEAVRILIEAGANPNETKNSKHILDLAHAGNFSDLFHALQESGANVTSSDTHVNSSYVFSSSNGNGEDTLRIVRVTGKNGTMGNSTLQGQLESALGQVASQALSNVLRVFQEQAALNNGTITNFDPIRTHVEFSTAIRHPDIVVSDKNR